MNGFIESFEAVSGQHNFENKKKAQDMMSISNQKYLKQMVQIELHR